MKPKLTEADFVRAAKTLGVSVATIKAVAEVESRGEGFLLSGEPVILFERHKFSAATGGKFDKSHPNISNPKAGGYLGGAAEHARLQEAATLDRVAALRSASWGKFQIMGYNHERAGHPLLQSFINAMYASEGEHLAAFVSFIKSDPKLHRALKERNWARFALRYNGSGYAKNKYDVKMAKAYELYEDAA